MEFFEKPSAYVGPLKHSVLGIIAFVFPVALVVIAFALCISTLVAYPPHSISTILVDRLVWILPLSFIGLVLGFAALKQHNTRKRFVKWGLVACAIPTVLTILTMLVRCCNV